MFDVSQRQYGPHHSPPNREFGLLCNKDGFVFSTSNGSHGSLSRSKTDRKMVKFHGINIPAQPFLSRRRAACHSRADHSSFQNSHCTADDESSIDECKQTTTFGNVSASVMFTMCVGNRIGYLQTVFPNSSRGFCLRANCLTPFPFGLNRKRRILLISISLHLVIYLHVCHGIYRFWRMAA